MIAGSPDDSGTATLLRAATEANLGSERRWSIPAAQRRSVRTPGVAVLTLIRPDRRRIRVINRPQRGSQPSA